MFNKDNPLSVFNYFKHNKKKFFSLYAACMVGVFVLYFMQVILSSSITNVNKGSLNILQNFSVVAARNYYITDESIQKLKTMRSTEKVMPCMPITSYYKSAAGFGTSVGLFEMYTDDIKYMMKKLNMHITQGRMISDYGSEIIMNEQLAKNKGLKVGDSFGSMDNPQEREQSSKTIVGLFDGNYLTGFESIKDETLMHPSIPSYSYGCVVIPKNTDYIALNKDLSNFSQSIIPNSYDYITYDYVLNELSDFYKTYGTTFYILYFFIIFLTCLGLSFLSYIYYSGRTTEFATLNAIGFTKQQLIKKSFLEITFINVLSFITGVILAIIACAIVNVMHYEPLGQDLYIISSESLIHAACCPVFVTLLSIIPIWILFRKLDPIKIIEGEY